jgi:hypothetical protein
MAQRHSYVNILAKLSVFVSRKFIYQLSKYQLLQEYYGL